MRRHSENLISHITKIFHWQAIIIFQNYLFLQTLENNKKKLMNFLLCNSNTHTYQPFFTDKKTDIETNFYRIDNINWFLVLLLYSYMKLWIDTLQFIVFFFSFDILKQRKYLILRNSSGFAVTEKKILISLCNYTAFIEHFFYTLNS